MLTSPGPAATTPRITSACSYGTGKDEPFPYTLFPTEALSDPPFTVVHHLPEAGDSYQVRRVQCRFWPLHRCMLPRVRA